MGLGESEDTVHAVRASAGTAVLFTSDLWHCSGPNTSPRTRRVYMPQYCTENLVQLCGNTSDSERGSERDSADDDDGSDSVGGHAVSECFCVDLTSR